MLKPVPNCLVWYKGRAALIAELGEKITIILGAGKKQESVKVREKDIEVLHPGPITDLTGYMSKAGFADSTEKDNEEKAVHDAWELIESGGSPVTLRELTELIYGEFTALNAWAARLILEDGLYFTGSIDAIHARNSGELSAIKEKRFAKEKESRDREIFLERLQKGTFDPKEDSRFLQDVEALAFGKTDKSRTMKELGRTETPEEAHRLLLECGAWDKQFNPYPRRFDLSPGAETPEKINPEVIDSLNRINLTHLPAFAIDSPWSNDPDDAVSLEYPDPKTGSRILYVHVADPASVIENESPPDQRARARGATLYLPEGAWPMLGEEVVSYFALGVKGIADKALSFKIYLDKNGDILDTEIFPSVVKVTRLSYKEADALIEEAEKNSGEPASDGARILKDLNILAEANFQRRLNAGAVHIVLPEVHITASNDKIIIQPLTLYRSADLVRECMLIAGEGAALWAAGRKLPFPYITQETGDLPSKPLPGIAGSYQLRRCMRPRAVSAKPGYHRGLGLDSYSQVTSPLRRYTDLLAHQQIRACLCKEAGISNPAPLNEEEILFCLAAGDAAAQNAVQAERASKTHWTVVYLDEMLCKDPAGEFLWEAVVTEKRTNGLGIIIPGLGLETQIGGESRRSSADNCPGDLLNDVITVRLKSVRIPLLEANFIRFR